MNAYHIYLDSLLLTIPPTVILLGLFLIILGFIFYERIKFPTEKSNLDKNSSNEPEIHSEIDISRFKLDGFKSPLKMLILLNISCFLHLINYFTYIHTSYYRYQIYSYYSNESFLKLFLNIIRISSHSIVLLILLNYHEAFRSTAKEVFCKVRFRSNLNLDFIYFFLIIFYSLMKIISIMPFAKKKFGNASNRFNLIENSRSDHNF